MIAPEQKISDDLSLVAPDLKRDLPLSVGWRSGEIGRATQTSMGIHPDDIKDPTFEEEKELIRDFIDSNDEIVWMIKLGEKIVGAVEIHLESTENLKAPALHIMIGDVMARGQGVGAQCMQAAIDYLRSKRTHEVYSRYLTSNTASSGLCRKLGFELDGAEYDEDGLWWQNVRMSLG